MILKMEIGTHVRAVSQKLDGIICRNQDNIYYVRDNDGFEWPMYENELVVIDMTSFEEVQAIYQGRVPAKQAKSYSRHKTTKIGGKGVNPKIVDLHQESLPLYSRNMSDTEIHELQKQTIVKTIEQEKTHQGTQIVFIHGKGNGILRNDLIKLLSKYKLVCKYEDAPFHLYGYHGAIKVTII